MVGKLKQKREQVSRPEAAEVENEGRQPGWIQKYLDLADLLMRRRKTRRDEDHPKAA